MPEIDLTWLRSLTGGILAAIYLLIGSYIAQDEIRHTGGGWINLRGMGTYIVTAPSQATLGNLLGWLGVPRVSYSDLGVLGYAQIIAHVLFTTGFVYLLGCGLEWLARRIFLQS
jgi:hypothetical protein